MEEEGGVKIGTRSMQQMSYEGSMGLQSAGPAASEVARPAARGADSPVTRTFTFLKGVLFWVSLSGHSLPTPHKRTGNVLL